MKRQFPEWEKILAIGTIGTMDKGLISLNIHEAQHKKKKKKLRRGWKT